MSQRNMFFNLISSINAFVLGIDDNVYQIARNSLYPYGTSFPYESPYDYTPSAFTDLDVGVRHLQNERRSLNAFPLRGDDQEGSSGPFN